MVALANHGSEHWKIAKDLTISLKPTATVAAIMQGQELFSLLVSVVKKNGGRIDLLACNLLSYDPFLVLGLEEFYEGVDFAASSNRTGNTTLPESASEKLEMNRDSNMPASPTAASGADWVMESDSIDIAKDYFDANRLKAYDSQMILGLLISGYNFCKKPSAGNAAWLGLSILTFGVF